MTKVSCLFSGSSKLKLELENVGVLSFLSITVINIDTDIFSGLSVTSLAMMVSGYIVISSRSSISVVVSLPVVTVGGWASTEFDRDVLATSTLNLKKYRMK